MILGIHNRLRYRIMNTTYEKFSQKQTIDITKFLQKCIDLKYNKSRVELVVDYFLFSPLIMEVNINFFFFLCKVRVIIFFLFIV